MANNRKWCSLPCSSYDVERIESWLQDMAKEGWILEGESAYWLGFFTFTKAEPQVIRYRLEPKTNLSIFDDGSPDGEALELYQEYGWEFVTQFHTFYIYRTADPAARELNTDYAVQAAALKHIKRNSISTLIAQAFLAIYWIPRISKEAYRFLVTFHWSVFPAFILLLITAVVCAVRDFLHIRKLRKQLKNNIPLDHNKPWQKNAKSQRIKKWALLLLYVYVLTTIFVSCSQSMNSSLEHTPLDEFPGDPPFVTCADLGSFKEESLLDSYNTYKHYSTSLAPTIIEWDEYGTIRTDDGRTLHGSLLIDYYETVSPALARGLVDDFLYSYRKYNHFAYMDAPEIDADYVVAFHYIYPTILIQKDNIFICATVGLEYQEEYILDEWAHKMAEYLQK